MIEVRERGVWRAAEGVPARVTETDVLTFRGLAPDESIRLGPVRVAADATGMLAVRLSQYEELDCHVGMLSVESVDWCGEVEIVPGKMSQEAFDHLRAELEATWTGLVLEDGAPTSLRARGPNARELWRQVGPAVDAIRREPLQRLEAVSAYRRLERVRRVGELTPAVLVAGQKGLAARSRIVGAVSAAPEHAFVADTLRRLISLARRQHQADDIVDEALRWLRDSPFDVQVPLRPVGSLHGIRHDRRFRMVQQVRRALDHPSAILTEGPGELRLGVRGLNRLYEYWVYLQVLGVARDALGPPEEPGFEVLARRMVGNRLRLELSPGTTVRFRGGWMAAFEPKITRNPATSWQGIEYVPHPDPKYQRTFVTPDVCVLGPGNPPRLYVIDAKYRGRHMIDAALAETHACYSRLGVGGRGIVEEVMVAHPHESLALRWAGQSARAFFPGGAELRLPWFGAEASIPTEVDITSSLTMGPGSSATALTDAPPQMPPAPAVPGDDRPKTTSSKVVIILDQSWMRNYLGDRRIDLGALGRRLAGGRRFDARIIAPDLIGLEGFFDAASRRGWTVERTGLPRWLQLQRLQDICAEAGDSEVYIVSDDADFIEAAKARRNVAVIREA